MKYSYLVRAVKSYDLDLHPWIQCEIKLVDDIKIFFIKKKKIISKIWPKGRGKGVH